MKANTATTIDEYIEGFTGEVRKRLKQMRVTIRKAAPEATEKISYRIPTFYLKGNLVHFAAFTKHIGFFPTARGVAAFKKEIRPYKTSKGTVQFQHDEPLPLDLVTKIVKFRVAENAKQKRK